MPEPQECAACAAITTERLAFSIDHKIVAMVPLCHGHALAVKDGRWALQVEPEWGGPWVLGAEYRR